MDALQHWLQTHDRTDALTILLRRLDKGKGTGPCGRGWVGTKPNCKRSIKKSKEELDGYKARAAKGAATKAKKKAASGDDLSKKSLKDLFDLADQVGSKYQSPNDPADLSARRTAKKIVDETLGVAKARATGKVASLDVARKRKTGNVTSLESARQKRKNK